MLAASALILLAFGEAALLNGHYADDQWASVQLEQAETHFRLGVQAGSDQTKAIVEFRAAAGGFQNLVDSGYNSCELFLNLGNAHFLADELPKAIMAYRLGLRGHPHHAELWRNLEAARDRVGYPEGPTRHRPTGEVWPPWMPRPSPDATFNAALGLYSIAWVAVCIWLFTKRRPALIVAGVLFSAAIAAVAWWGFLKYTTSHDAKQPQVVVSVNGVTLRRGNGSLYPRHPVLPIVNRGMEARLVSERGGWMQVEFPGGDIGWLPRAAVETWE